MTTMLVTLALVTLAAVLVSFALRAKNLALPHSVRAWEDDEQMRLVRTTSGSGEPSVVATLH